jgi:hypothetical protein
MDQKLVYVITDNSTNTLWARSKNHYESTIPTNKPGAFDLTAQKQDRNTDRSTKIRQQTPHHLMRISSNTYNARARKQTGR